MTTAGGWRELVERGEAWAMRDAEIVPGDRITIDGWNWRAIERTERGGYRVELGDEVREIRPEAIITWDTFVGTWRILRDPR